MRAKGWLLLAATAVLFFGAGMVAAALDRASSGSDMVAQTRETTQQAPESAPVRVIDLSGPAAAAGDRQDRASRLPIDGEARLIHSTLESGMAVAVREPGEGSGMVMSVDPALGITTIAKRVDLPRLSLDPSEDGRLVVTAAVDRAQARSIVLEAIPSGAEMANAIFFRTDIGFVAR